MAGDTGTRNAGMGTKMRPLVLVGLGLGAANQRLEFSSCGIVREFLRGRGVDSHYGQLVRFTSHHTGAQVEALKGPEAVCCPFRQATRFVEMRMVNKADHVCDGRKVEEGLLVQVLKLRQHGRRASCCRPHREEVRNVGKKLVA